MREHIIQRSVLFDTIINATTDVQIYMKLIFHIAFVIGLMKDFRQQCILMLTPLSKGVDCQYLYRLFVLSLV